VIGVRWGKTSGMPVYRRAGKRVLDYATSAGVRKGALTDSQSGYRAFSREAVMQLEPTESGLAIESQMLIEAQARNLRIKELDIEVRYDIDGSNRPPGRHGFSVLGRLIALLSERRPLFFFGIGGAVLLVSGTLLGVTVVETYYTTRELAVGYLFAVAISTILGSLSIFMGIVLNVIRKIART